MVGLCTARAPEWTYCAAGAQHGVTQRTVRLHGGDWGIDRALLVDNTSREGRILEQHVWKRARKNVSAFFI
jgi:hypothetical protein